MSIEGIVLITSVEFTAPKDLELKINNESKNVVLEKKSPNDFVNGTPDGFKHYTDGTVVFLIDVHCSVPGAEKLQLQGGVVVYRHLLNLFKDKQDKLKVIFYSPLSKDLLVKSRPENYVLKRLPFIECKYDGASNFENALSGQIAEFEPAKWPRFNNASENLLSGWALANEKLIKSGKCKDAKIKLNDRKALVIDDEWKEWELTYKTILDAEPEYFLSDSEDIKSAFRKLNNGTFSHLDNAKSLAKYDFIISDLYLWERHETDRFKTEDLIRSISGFLLFQKIRNMEPALPVVFHTTSTKFRIFDALSSIGADGQVLKNTAFTANVSEKLENYRNFRSNLEVVKPYRDCWLNDFYRFLDSDMPGSWVTEKEIKTENPEIYTDALLILKNLIIDFKSLGKLRSEYLRSFFKQSSSLLPLSLTMSGIVVNAAKISELLDPNSRIAEFTLLKKLRDQGAHSYNDYSLRQFDVLLLLSLIDKTLRSNNPNRVSGSPFPKHGSFGANPRTQSRRNHPVLHFAHYYNGWASFVPDELVPTFEGRIRFLFKDFLSKVWDKLDADGRGRMVGSIKVLEFGSESRVEFVDCRCKLYVMQ